MPRKYISSYKKLAAKRGYSDPLCYLWGRYEALKREEKHVQAQELALMLLPYGHGKQAPRDGNDDTVRNAVFVLE